MLNCFPVPYSSSSSSPLSSCKHYMEQDRPKTRRAGKIPLSWEILYLISKVRFLLPFNMLNGLLTLSCIYLFKHSLHRLNLKGKRGQIWQLVDPWCLPFPSSINLLLQKAISDTGRVYGPNIRLHAYKTFGSLIPPRPLCIPFAALDGPITAQIFLPREWSLTKENKLYLFEQNIQLTPLPSAYLRAAMWPPGEGTIDKSVTHGKELPFLILCKNLNSVNPSGHVCKWTLHEFMINEEEHL